MSSEGTSINFHKVFLKTDWALDAFSRKKKITYKVFMKNDWLHQSHLYPVKSWVGVYSFNTSVCVAPVFPTSMKIVFWQCVYFTAQFYVSTIHHHLMMGNHFLCIKLFVLECNDTLDKGMIFVYQSKLISFFTRLKKD